MALPPLVTVVEFEEWLGATLTEPDLARAEAVLIAVSALVRSQARLTWLVDNAVSGLPDEVAAVTKQVARRVFNNPDSVKQESIGNYSVNYGNARSIGLYLESEEKKLIGAGLSNPRGLWSLRITRDDPASDTEWVPIVGTEALFPWYAAGDPMIE